MGQAPIPYAVTQSEGCTLIGASPVLSSADVANGTGTDPVCCHSVGRLYLDRSQSHLLQVLNPDESFGSRTPA
jgi:hypothetical protein